VGVIIDVGPGRDLRAIHPEGEHPVVGACGCGRLPVELDGMRTVGDRYLRGGVPAIRIAIGFRPYLIVAIGEAQFDPHVDCPIRVSGREDKESTDRSVRPSPFYKFKKPIIALLRVNKKP